MYVRSDVLSKAIISRQSETKCHAYGHMKVNDF